jgi:hypothetical protein
MKQVWQANDGSIHEGKGQAVEREALLREIRSAKRLVLPKKMDTCEFANGNIGPIQLTEEQYDVFRAAYLALIDEHCSSKVKELAHADPIGIVGRYLCDGDSPLYGLYSTMCCIDSKLRLWGQPYLRNKADGLL